MKKLICLVSCMISAVAFADPPDNKSLPAPATGKIDFAREVQPIFVESCVSCHGPKRQRSGFRLDQKAAAFKGGDTGRAIIPGKSAESLLIRYVAGLDPDVVMPPGDKRLTSAQIGILRAWIDQGADWPESAIQEVKKEETWWSLRPLAKSPPPPTETLQANPIDAFILAKLKEMKLAPSPEADRRTLVRRVYFDLIGLPPSPDEVDAFVRDESSQAYEKLVDRLLASPQYGERWARHWLDVVHFGETHGYDKDQPRVNAWPYRDYVIRAFNEDKPYWRFVQEQVAGDMLFPGAMDGIQALGFISAGPWDLIGHVEVPETRIDGKITRHLDRDDMVANTMGTFTSITVSCAQCHDHKFDPITMEDYYSLHAVFAALDRADRPYDADPKTLKQREALGRRESELSIAAKNIEAQLKRAGGARLADLDSQIAKASKGVRRPETGYHSDVEASDDKTKWVQVDLGEPRTIERISITGCYDTFNGIGAGFGFPKRFKIEVSDDPKFERGVDVVVDRTSRDVANPGIAPQIFNVACAGRYVRVTAHKLAHRKNDYIFALAELEVFEPTGKNVGAGKAVTALDSIERPPSWSKKNLVDGIVYSPPADSERLQKLHVDREELIKSSSDPNLYAEFQRTTQDLVRVQDELRKLPPRQLVYSGTIHHGVGPFQGTGSNGGKPRPISILSRGDVRKPGREVGPGALSALKELPARFGLPAGHAEGERRAALARWLTDSKNPLTWRSIVNRVWLYHFGRALVESPNDFGRMGQLPTHPELLDWLAVEFRDGGQSFKKLHRLIVTSAAYRQGSADRPEASQVDSNNQYYWRMNRRRLEAEAIRDGILSVAGKLNVQMGGPSFQDFVIRNPEHSPHYKYELHDPDDSKSHRRSIYRFIVRSQQQPFMTALDCADPSLAVEKRNQTTTPQQALALLNNQLMLVMAKHFAARVEAIERERSKQPAIAFRLALGRSPTPAELTTLSAYTQEHGLPSLCRVILNLNEFVYVD